MQIIADKLFVMNKLSFVICEECFWCLSMMSSARSISKCIVCSSNRIASIPLAQNESYRYTVTEMGGLEIKFSTRRRDSKDPSKRNGTYNSRELSE
jgi:hypothetical protein